jgi:hypothetical protein
MKLDGTTKLSRRFAEALFAMYADWEQFARVVRDGNTDTKHMEIEVPQSGTERVLHLSTANDEVTITFDQWHTHIGPFLGISPEETVATALQIIEDFITEQTIVQISYRDGAWLESGLPYRAALGELKPNSTTRVYSWLGTYDNTIETP